MYSSVVENLIPKYAIEPDTVTGNKIFKIAKADCAVVSNKSDLLIPHRKDYYFLVFVRQGSSRHWIDMTPYTLKPDTFYFTTPPQVHVKEDVITLTGTSVSFTDEFLELQGNGFLKKLPVIQNPHNGHELVLNNSDILFIDDILDKIYAEYHTRHNWQQSMLLAYIQVLLIYLSRLYTTQFDNAELFSERLLLKKYLSKIEESFTEMHEVSAYANELNISAGYLSELVKKQSGKAPIVHIHDRLVLEAKRLLFHKDYSIKQIAFQLGFEDPSYFNRFFKRLTTHTPAEYRSANRKMYH